MMLQHHIFKRVAIVLHKLTRQGKNNISAEYSLIIWFYFCNGLERNYCRPILGIETLLSSDFVEKDDIFHQRA